MQFFNSQTVFQLKCGGGRGVGRGRSKADHSQSAGQSAFSRWGLPKGTHTDLRPRPLNRAWGWPASEGSPGSFPMAAPSSWLAWVGGLRYPLYTWKSYQKQTEKRLMCGGCGPSKAPDFHFIPPWNLPLSGHWLVEQWSLQGLPWLLTLPRGPPHPQQRRERCQETQRKGSMEKVANEPRSIRSLPAKVCRKLMRPRTRKEKVSEFQHYDAGPTRLLGGCVIFLPAKRIRDVGSKKRQKDRSLCKRERVNGETIFFQINANWRVFI